jgi:hypothetical protein
VDITIYLPDELGKWAKEHDLGLSRMLRDAVEAEKRRRETAAAALKDAKTYDLTVEDEEGRMYTARLHGALLVEAGINGVTVFLGKDEKIYLYNDACELLRDASTSDLREWLDDGPYAEAMHALGEEVVIDVGLPG